MAAMKLQLDQRVQEYLSGSLRSTHSKQAAADTQPSDLPDLLAVLASAPRFTTLRANTRACDITRIEERLSETLTQQYTAKDWAPPEVVRHAMVPDLLVVPSRCRAVSPASKEVIVDVPCGMAVLRGADVFVRGVLAASPVMAAGDLVAVFADLSRRCRRGLTKPYDGEKVFIGNGVAEVSREAVFRGDGNELSGVGIRMTQPLYQAPSLDGLLPDLLYPQNLPSVVCVHVLDPQPGETILDMCAAPGGKTVHIASLMENKGRLVAFDKSKNKMKKIRENCGRWGVTCVEPYHFDGTRSVNKVTGEGSRPPYEPGTFDRVLVDAPCSALGQRPSLSNKMTLAEVTSYPPLQRKLLSQAVQLLKPGGTLVYSTCTIPQEENEGLVAWALRHHTDIQLSPQCPHLGGHGWSYEGLSADHIGLLQRFDPSALTREHSMEDTESSSFMTGSKHGSMDRINTDTIGFFIAKFVKIER